MRHLRLAIACACALAQLLTGSLVIAQQITPADSKQSEEQAMAVVKRIADFLSHSQSFSVTAEIGFDAVQQFGQKIEYGESRKIVLRRPDHLRIDETKRNGAKSGLVFDGRNLTVFHVKENVYATTARPGNVDEAIAYYTNDLDMRLPLAELLSSKLAAALSEGIREAAYVEKSSIGGVPCDHVALRGDKADLQLWVAQGDRPLPQRIVITYTRLDGRPQFWAQFKEWNLNPKVRDSLFAFTPPAGAVKIAFSPRQMLEPAGTGINEGK